MNEWKGISKWKKVEKMYVMDELVYGHNPYWWAHTFHLTDYL